MYRMTFRDAKGVVKDIIQDRGRIVPLAVVEYEDGEKGYIPAREGISVNDSLDDVVMPLSLIPESKPIFAIESKPNSGPVFCRTGGSVAFIVSKDEKNCVVQFPSKKTRTFSFRCRAIVGTPAGSGRGDKPWIKAGKKWTVMHKKGKLYPITSANAMNAVDHPFGGAYSGVNKPKTVTRNAPPGRKVGTVASKRTGRKKR